MNVEEKLLINGYDDVIVFSNFSYDDALVGVSDDGRAIYDYTLMIEWLVENQGFSEKEAEEWIDYNTLGAVSPDNENAPIIMYPLIDD